MQHLEKETLEMIQRTKEKRNKLLQLLKSSGLKNVSSNKTKKHKKAS